MTINYAESQGRSADLSTDFGLQLACKKFGFTPEEIAEKMGRYVRGKRKGLLKGSISWYKVTRGGWVKTGPYDHDNQRACGFIAKNGVCFAFQLTDGNGNVVAENHVAYKYTRREKTLDVWRSYAEQERLKYRKQAEPAPEPKPVIYGVISLPDGKINAGKFYDKTFDECERLVGQHVELSDLLGEKLISGTLVSVTIKN